MILDIAAGILIAAAIMGIIWFGLQMVEAGLPKGEGGPSWFIVALGILAGVALVLWRLLRAHG